MDIINAIKSEYDSLSRVQKRIATYVLDHAEDACFLSLKAFSEKVNASEVTIINFTHRIGLKSFLDFKHELQNLMRTRATPNDKLARALTALSSQSNHVKVCIDNEKQLLDRTFSALTKEQLATAVEMIEHAGKINIIGNDISLPVVNFMVIRMRYLGLDVAPLTFDDAHHTTLCMSQSTQDTLFILVSFPVHSQKMQAVSSLLQKKGIKTLALVSDAECVVASNATHTLCCDTSDLLFYNSITAAISLVNVLCSEYASLHQDQLIQTRQHVQTIVDELSFELQLQHSHSPSGAPHVSI